MVVNTGRAFFGYILEKPSFLTVIGDTINIAARLTELAPPGTILISEDIYDKVQAYVEAEGVGKKSIKGKRDQIDVYILKDIIEESKVAATQKLPFFGREKELKRLINIAEGIKKNRLALCAIGGQMGIGKTRLKEEFKRYLAEDKTYNFFETHCAIEIQSPYYPFRFLIREYFKLNEFDSQEEMANRIDKIIAEKGLSPMDARGVKHLFLTNLRRLQYEQVREINEEIFAAIKNLIRYECRTQPLVLIFEEFNKADVMTKDLVTYLLSELENEPLMFLMVNISKEFIMNLFTPIEEINLTPLSLKDIYDLSKFILQDVDEKLIEFVYHAAGGNPLFTIEAIRHSRRTKLIKEVSGRWFLVREQQLPFLDDLYGVVMSTIDSLSSQYRLILDYASVIGYGFSLRMLNELLSRSDLTEQLNYLVNEGYIILSRDEQDPIYFFRHNLLKDAAYSILPLKKRKEIHQQVAGLFEKLYTDQLSDFYENIGHHYLSCESFKKAASYLKLAGDKAKNLYAIERALSFYNTVLKIKKDADEEIPNDLIRDILLSLTDLYEITGDIPKMQKIAYEGIQSARKDKDFENEIIFSERNGYALILNSQFNEAEELLLVSVQRCNEKMGNILTILYSDLGVLYTTEYEYEKGVLYYNLAWNIARSAGIKNGEVSCLLNLAQLHRNLGNYEQALDYLNYTLENLLSPEDMRLTTQFKYHISDINFQIWNLEKTTNLLQETLSVSESIGNIEIYIKSALGLAVINSINGNHEEAEKYLKFVDKKISFFIRESLLAEVNLNKALIYYNKNDFRKAKDYLINNLEIARRLRNKEIECRCNLLLSLIDKNTSIENAKKALEIAEALKLPPLIALAMYGLAHIFVQNNEIDKARYYGTKALLLFDDLKSKLSEEDRQFYIHKPEYVKLLEI